jgi:hypothetical protein
MFGTYKVLLQQDHIDRLENGGFDSTHPCHIYMVMRRPRIMLDPDSIKFEEKTISGAFNIQKGNSLEPHTFSVPNFLGASKLRIECLYPHTEFSIYDELDNKLSSGKVAFLIASFGEFWRFLSLEVLYIGQSFGVEGARTAPERLKNHSTLQGIYAEAIRRSPDQEIWLLLWSFEQLLYMSFDGRQDTYGTSLDEDDAHIHQVLKTGITEQQQINFTEAALIRYFEPEYNKLFKDSFPSPAHKTYSECYDLDINFVAVELQTEDIMCQLWSPKVAPTWIHIAKYLLHSPEERKSMFDLF